IFYSIEMLPGIWHDISLFNPILYMVNTFRYGMLGVSDIDLTLAYGVIFTFIAILYSFCLWLLKSGKGTRS
ncbi:MAG: ABC transporter permease, partial [Gammaproteobacteria bacterium]|nr:ABC transporter permease [Gammaproteobacteria bacterium]